MRFFDGSVKVHLLLILSSIAIFAAAQVLAAAGDRYPIPRDMLMLMQRGNCEGGCPVYRVAIFSNGDVVWQGTARVAKVGVLQSHLEPDQVRDLIDEFRSIDYLHLENIYDYRGKGCQSTKPDMPIVITYFAINGESRTLTHHDGCVGDVSDKLNVLESKIDTVVNTAPWISGRLPPKRAR